MKVVVSFDTSLCTVGKSVRESQERGNGKLPILLGLKCVGCKQSPECTAVLCRSINCDILLDCSYVLY